MKINHLLSNSHKMSADVIVPERLFKKYFDFDEETNILKHKRNEEVIQLIKSKQIKFTPLKDKDGKFPLILFITIQRDKDGAVLRSRPWIETEEKKDDVILSIGKCDHPYITPDYQIYLSDGTHRIANPEKVQEFIKLMDESKLDNNEFSLQKISKTMDSGEVKLSENVDVKPYDSQIKSYSIYSGTPSLKECYFKRTCGHYSTVSDGSCYENNCSGTFQQVSSCSCRTFASFSSPNNICPQSTTVNRDVILAQLFSFVQRMFSESIVFLDDFNSRTATLPTKNEMEKFEQRINSTHEKQLSDISVKFDELNLKKEQQQKEFQSQLTSLNGIKDEATKMIQSIELSSCIMDIYKRLSNIESEIVNNSNSINSLSGDLLSNKIQTKSEIDSLNNAYERLYSFKIGKLVMEPFGERDRYLFINRRFNIVYDYAIKKVVGIYQDKQLRPLTSIEKEFCNQNKLEVKIEWDDILVTSPLY